MQAQIYATHGMVLVAGDRYGIGIEKKAAVKLIEATQQRALASEYPRHTVRLDDFFYMPTEVTNEQFAAFVRATDEPRAAQRIGDYAIVIRRNRRQPTCDAACAPLGSGTAAASSHRGRPGRASTRRTRTRSQP